MSELAGISVEFTDRARLRSRFEGRRILYVDDDDLMRRAMTRLLRRAGAVCLCTGSHDHAIALLASELLLDLAVLDFQMPDGDVGRLVRRLRRLRPAVALVGTSGSDRRSEFAARGVGHFLAKPWGLDDLARAAGWSEAAARAFPSHGP